MSLFVCQAIKCKKSDVRGLQIHNQRESKEGKNEDIDHSRTHLNYDLHNSEHISYTKKVNQIMKEGYTKADAPKRDAVQMVSVLISSDKEFFDKLTPEQTREYFQINYDYLKEIYGEKNIVNSMVHLDEKTPHMTFQYVPLTEDGRLCAKEVNGKTNLNRMQEELPKLLRERGFVIDRGEISKGKHLRHKDHNQHKLEELQAKGKELAAQEKDINKRVVEISRIAITDNKVKTIAETARDKKGLFGGNTGEVILPKEEFEQLIASATVGAVAREENGHLHKKIEIITADKKNLQEMTINLQQENYGLKSKVNEYERLINDRQISQRIQDIKNPHIAAYRELKASVPRFDFNRAATQHEEIAYRMIKGGQFEQSKVQECLRTDLSRDESGQVLSAVNTRIAQELIKEKEVAEKAKVQAERERAKAEHQKKIDDRLNFLKSNPHVARYHEYRRKKMSDTLAIFYMKNIDKMAEWRIKEAIVDSGQTSEYARKCISEVNKIKVPTSYEVKQGVDFGLVLNRQLQHAHDRSPAPTPTPGIVAGIANLLNSNAASKNVALNASSRGEDYSCIDWGAMDDFDRKEMQSKMREGQSVER